MITVTIRVKLILKAFGYTVAILVGAFIFAIIVLAATSNQDLTTCTFWGGLFLGTLAVLTDELKKREASLTQDAHERSTVAVPSDTSELAAYALGTHQVSTATSIDLNLGIFDLHVGVRTDLERSKSVPSRARAYQPDHTGLKGNTDHDHDRNIYAL